MVLKLCHDREVWDDFILENNGHPLQLWGWGELKQSQGWKVVRLFFSDKNDKQVGAASVLIKKLPWPFRSLAYIPRGPVVDDRNREDMLRELARYIKKTHGSLALTVEPDSLLFELPTGWKKSKNYILPNRTILLDLKKSEDELLQDMAKKTRQYIRKSGSCGLEIKKVKSGGELEACLKLYHETAKRADFPLHNDDYYRAVADNLKSNSPIFVAYHDSQPVAFLWLAVSAETAYELYGGMNDVGQQTRANYALKWHAIRKCKEWGMKRYDFGGLLKGGVTTFKMGWATAETELAGTFDKPLSVFYGLWNFGLPKVKLIIRKLKTILSKK